MSREELEGHLRVAEEKLAAARVLLGSGFPRDAVSRSYYAMFHAASALARSVGDVPRTHRGLGHVLNDRFVKPGVLTRDELEFFRREQAARELGDYGADVALGIVDAEEFLERATAFVARVREVLSI